MTDTLNPPPFGTDGQIDSVQIAAEIWRTVVAGAIDYCQHCALGDEETMDLLRRLNVPEKFWPTFTEERTYTVRFTASVAMEREVEIEVDLNDTNFDLEEALQEALQNECLYPQTDDEVDYVESVNDWERSY